MAAVLEERQKERSARHCPTCTCSTNSRTSSNRNRTEHRNDDADRRNSQSNLDDADQTRSTFRRSENLDLNVIDVGTQTVASYIGETGKVRSTCIYCHSSKNMSGYESVASNSPINNEDKILHNLKSIKTKKPSKKSHSSSPNKDESISEIHGTNENNFSPSIVCPWDWSLESQDSGSPSTPTSLTSTSLSYESEASNFTSPQDSPGRISLPTNNTLSKISPNTKLASSSNNSNDSQAVLSTSNIKPSRTSPYHAMISKLVLNSNIQGLSQPNNSNKISHSNNFNNNNNRLQFNTRSTHTDVFTPPIHQSPSMSSSKAETGVKSVISSADRISYASSTTTASATETSL